MSVANQRVPERQPLGCWATPPFIGQCILPCSNRFRVGRPIMNWAGCASLSTPPCASAFSAELLSTVRAFSSISCTAFAMPETNPENTTEEPRRLRRNRRGRRSKGSIRLHPLTITQRGTYLWAAICDLRREPENGISRLSPEGQVGSSSHRSRPRVPKTA